MISCCLCGSWALGIPGCGAFKYLEETWEERWYRKKRKEGGRAQYGAGTLLKGILSPLRQLQLKEGPCECVRVTT